MKKKKPQYRPKNRKKNHDLFTTYTFEGYIIVTGGNFEDFLLFFTEPETTVFVDYSLEDLMTHPIKEQATALFVCSGRFYETNVPLTILDNYLSNLNTFIDDDGQFITDKL